MKYRILDTFNRVVVSEHKTLRTAVSSLIKFQRNIRRWHGEGSYLPTVIEQNDGPGAGWVQCDEWDVTNAKLDNEIH